MKSRIFMYLFVFSVLLAVFLYANSKSILDKYEKDIKTFKAEIETQKGSISKLEDANFEFKEQDFNLEHNEDAITYFESKGYDIAQLISVIRDGLYEKNNYTGEDHPIVPFVSMTDSKLVIDKIKLLNHKWIIANFTDGKHWGEVFLTYEIGENNTPKYEVQEG